MGEPVISCEGLRREFPGGVALDGLSLEVEPGTVLALLGPNGAGKTTTIRLLNGILAPHGGSARVLGLDPFTQGDALRARTGVLTEQAGLDDRLTATENLLATARMRGMADTFARPRVRELLGLFGMGDHADQRCQGFSTGQRRRVALARALLHDPELLFLDEPTSGLDPAATSDVIDLIEMLTAERGRTVVLCTHFLAEAGRLADQMAILHRGRLLTSGRPMDLAAQLWPGLDVELVLGEAIRPEDRDRLVTLAGVMNINPGPTGAIATVVHRDVVPSIVADLVHHGVDVFAATPRPKTLEDVYFAYQDTLGEDTAKLIEAMR